MYSGFCIEIPLNLVRLPWLYKNMPDFSLIIMILMTPFGLFVLLSNDSSDNFYEEFLRRDSSPFATSSLQDGEDENLCALGNLGLFIMSFHLNVWN